MKVISLLKKQISFSELLPLFSARKDMLKLFPKTLLLIVSLFLMDGVLVHGVDSVLGPFLERRSDFLLIANKNSGEGDIEETDLRLEEDEAVEDLFDEDDFDETMDRNVQGTEKENGLFEDARFSLNHQLGYRFQAPEKIVSNRTSLRLEWNSDISENLLFQFDGKGILHYADDHLTKAHDPSQGYFVDFNMREFYFLGSFGKWAFKVGRQVVIWGESDASVLDVVSPQDFREIYFTSLEDSRIAQNLARITYFSPQSEWDLFINPDPQTNKYPQPETEYHVPLPEDDPGYQILENSNVNTEFGLRFKKYYESGDYAFFAASLNENQPSYSAASGTGNEKIELEKKYPPYQLLGVGGNMIFSNTMVKAELAYKFNQTFAAKTLTEPVYQKNTVETAWDFEYLIHQNAKWVVGLKHQHILEWEENINENKNTTDIFLGGNHLFFHQTLELEYSLNHDPKNEDSVHRLTMLYRIMDDLKLEISTVHFYPSDSSSGILAHYRGKSRLSAGMTYYF